MAWVPSIPPNPSLSSPACILCRHTIGTFASSWRSPRLPTAMPSSTCLPSPSPGNQLNGHFGLHAYLERRRLLQLPLFRPSTLCLCVSASVLMRTYGKRLLSVLPDDTTALLIALCIGRFQSLPTPPGSHQQSSHPLHTTLRIIPSHESSAAPLYPWFERICTRRFWRGFDDVMVLDWQVGARM